MKTLVPKQNRIILIKNCQIKRDIKIGPNIAKLALHINNNIIPYDQDVIQYECSYCNKILDEKVQSVKKKIANNNVIFRYKRL